MIIIETDRIYSILVRTNCRVQWRYAKYGGRWETPEKALEVAKAHMDEPFEYRIEELDGTLVKTGFIGELVRRKL